MRSRRRRRADRQGERERWRRENEVPAELLRTLAYITQFAPTFSLRGGTREVLRGLIARGLGLR